MNQRDEKQHYISRPLLSRLKSPGKPFECYQIATGEWTPRSLDNVCASGGYNQLLISGDVDNELETAFSKVESKLPGTLKYLEQAAANPETRLPSSVYENMCRYHAFLKLLSPAAKASAVVNFVLQLNLEIEIGQRRLLRELNIPEAIIGSWKRECSVGRKIIIDCPNILQLIFRYQFSRSYENELSIFRLSKWIVCNSPIEFPMSDIGLVPIWLTDTRAKCHLLPIGPKLLLISLFFFDLAKNSVARPIKSLTLTNEEARYWFDAICGSASVEIVCGHRLSGVTESLRHRKNNDFSFNRIVDMKNTKSAGLQDASKSLWFRVVSIDDYVKFVHSYIKPPPTKPSCAGT